jgi:hypothetical protein
MAMGRFEAVASRKILFAKNMHPVWIAIGPIRAWRYIVGCGAIIICIAIALLWLQSHLPSFLGKVVTIAFNLGVLVLVFRMIVNPTILHFGDDEEGGGIGPTALPLRELYIRISDRTLIRARSKSRVCLQSGTDLARARLSGHPALG